MSNLLDAATVSQIRALDAAGMSLRGIARQIGCSTNTVRRYIGGDSLRQALCKCGQPAGHKGWCVARYEASIRRQAYHAGRRGEVISVPPAEIVSRVKRAQQRAARILGLDGLVYAPIARELHYGVWGEVVRVTRRLSSDIRDDVRQEMFLRCIDGRFDPTDLPALVGAFAKFFRLGMRQSMAEVQLVLSGDGRSELDSSARAALEAFWLAEFGGGMANDPAPQPRKTAARFWPIPAMAAPLAGCHAPHARRGRAKPSFMRFLRCAWRRWRRSGGD